MGYETRIKDLSEERIVPGCTKRDRSLSITHVEPSPGVPKDEAPFVRSLFRSSEPKPAQIGFYPTMRFEQKHGFLMFTAFAERENPAIRRSPVSVAHMKPPNNIRSCDDQVTIGLLAGSKQAPKLQLIASHPHGRLCALEYPMSHFRKMMWVEAAGEIEARIATNLRPLSYAAINYNAGSVEIHRLSEATRLFPLSAKPVSPDTAEVCNRYPHSFTHLSAEG